MKRSIAALLLLFGLFGCAGAASTAAPSSPGAPTPAPTTIASVEEAAARVVGVYPTLSGIGPADPDLIGGCCSWQGTETDDGYAVTFEVGWGDCPAGCIDRHAWTFAVTRDGAVTLVDDRGSPVPSGMPGSDIGAGSSGSGGSTGGGIVPGGTGIQGRALAGPTCPVAKLNDRACEDRPLAGVTIVVLAANGDEAGRTTTDASGTFAFSLPPGAYTLEPQPVEGMMRGAEPIPVLVDDRVVTVDVAYDTGIR
ncbi:MAG TPA: carboxypeptidase-like regulatory domain-containing protein [Candidatus Limnocylindrales bacterium]|nr:carboxypeptidase-like regulatory domain-containing protein [Candidatus Limnocylindrales bacterium]